MRKQTSSSSLLDLASASIDGEDDPLDPSCPYEGLCCPDDPLDQVLNLNSAAFGYGIFELIGVGLSPPREPSGGGGGRGGGGEEDYKGAVERVAFGVRAAETSFGGSGSGGGAGSEVSVPGGGRGEDDAGSKSAVAEDMETEALDVKPVFGVSARAGANYMSAPGAGYMSVPVAGGIGTPGAFSERKLLPLPSYAGFGALTAWHADGAGAGSSGMAAPGAVPENRLLPLPGVGFDALTVGGAVRGGERVINSPDPDSVSKNKLPTLPGVRSATPSAPPGTPFRLEHAAPSSSVATTPSDSSLSSASLVSESSPVTSLPKALGLTRPRKRRTARRPQWSLICPLHLVPIAARHTHGGKSINALNASAFSSDGGSSGGGGEGGGSSGRGEGGGSYHRRVVGRQRNRQVRKDRRCSHCGTSETPQWRIGPEGPGTLCNACGIRSKMDRLLPEYRPSTSPSFNGDEHSNRHRKVLKLREKKVRD